MRHRTFHGFIISIIAGAMVAGCASHDVRTAAVPGASATAASSVEDLAGTWRGTEGSVTDFYQYVALDLQLQIFRDGGYILSATRKNLGNNVGKPYIEVGNAYRKGELIVLRSNAGGEVSLRRSGNSLYGLEQDRNSERAVINRLDRVT